MAGVGDANCTCTYGKFQSHHAHAIRDCFFRVILRSSYDIELDSGKRYLVLYACILNCSGRPFRR